ncbi:hypothetical protein BT63DRAFT_419613 [Microthyrium microscopicum]|uniref:Pinin/SDK/MemA protein domain-containing protein n=1 Tax=Microthyrium microscopicum TaxID=703497 RepID=A0A6A6USD3_9PEZI|nr:hypothetical protein BT63DRAFT_419613 [Microthyrium microscopicum]
MLASAVVVPDAPQPIDDSPAPISLKRRQLDLSEPDTKRTRLSPDETAMKTESRTQSPAPPVRPNVDTRRIERRQVGKEEERKRGKRMFGALLGTLAGAGTRTGANVQKRRADIERRAQEKLREQEESDMNRVRESVEVIRRRRMRQQWTFDEQALKTRHQNMLAMAQFLQTHAEPRLYFKPWKITTADEDEIDQQLRDAESKIEEEVEEFEHRRRQALDELDALEKLETNNGNTPQGSDNSKEEPSTEVGAEPITKSEETHSPNDNASNLASTTDVPAAEPIEKEEMSIVPREELMDEHQGETVVEADEDTVIY